MHGLIDAELGLALHLRTMTNIYVHIDRWSFSLQTAKHSNLQLSQTATTHCLNVNDMRNNNIQQFCLLSRAVSLSVWHGQLQ